mmetsp:Transcript_33896/g.95224  ORF Transcript_33896/g.95224 Transcript_33896/m.95224 type:complete len:279 (+) Transcript_33896:6494-7330(+)
MKPLSSCWPSRSVTAPKLQTSASQNSSSSLTSFSLAPMSLVSGSRGSSCLSRARYSFSRFETSQFWLTGTGCLTLRCTISHRGSTVSSKSSWIVSALSRRRSGSLSHQDQRSTRQPMSTCSKKTIPQRDTVAGDATARSSTSNIIVVTGDSLMISPLFRQSFLFSSMTVFMFSIQTASTGPSKTSHLRSSVWFLAMSRKSTATMPSVHSRETSSKQPYRSFAGTDFGLRRAWWTIWVACIVPSFAKSVSAFCSVLRAVVLPLNGRPTSMTLCRTMWHS